MKHLLLLLGGVISCLTTMAQPKAASPAQPAASAMRSPAQVNWKSIARQYNNRVTIAGDSGQIWRSGNFGRTWTPDTLMGVTWRLNAVSVPTSFDDSRYVVGDSGVFGMSQSARAFRRLPVSTRSSLRSVAHDHDWSGAAAVAVGDSGTIILHNQRVNDSRTYKIWGDSTLRFNRIALLSLSNDAANGLPYAAINAYMGADSGRVYRLRKTRAMAAPEMMPYNFDSITKAPIVGSVSVPNRGNSLFFIAADGKVILALNAADSLPNFRQVRTLCSPTTALTGGLTVAHTQWNYTGLIFYGQNGFASHTNYRDAGVVPPSQCFPTGTARTITSMVTFPEIGNARPFFMYVGDSGLVMSTQRGMQEDGGIKAMGSTLFCKGGSVNIVDTVNTPNTTFQWFRNGAQVAGATSSAIAARDSGTYYLRRRIFTGVQAEPDGGTVTMWADTISNSVRVNYLPAPARPVISLVGTDSLAAPVAGGVSYRWIFNRNVVATDTTGGLKPTVTGAYRVVAVNDLGCTSDTSAPINYMVCADIARNLNFRNDTALCSNSSLLLRYTPATGMTPTYQWFKNGNPINPGGTNNLQTVTDSGSYYLRITVGACVVFSDTLLIDFDDTPATPVITPNGSLDLCTGDSIVLTAPAGYARYRWATGGTVLTPYKDTTSNRLVLYAPISNLRLRVVGPTGCTSQASAAITATATTKPGIPQVLYNGTTISAASIPAPTGTTFRWFRDGVQLPNTGATITNPAAGSYRAVAVFRTCVSDTSATEIVASMKDVLAGAAFELAPNPAKGQVALSWTKPLSQALTISLTDLAGRVISTSLHPAGSGQSVVLPLNSVAKGLYLINIATEGGQITRRLVVE